MSITIKKVLFAFFLICTNFINAQTEISHLFSRYNYSLMSGISSEKFSHIFGVIYFEGSTNLTENIFIKLTAGYYKSISYSNYTVNTNKFVKINDYEKYYTVSYEVYNTEYRVIPILLGLEYYLFEQKFSPYFSIDASYNLIDPLTKKSQEIKHSEYDNYSEVPISFRNTDNIPNESFGLSFGVGSKLKISSQISTNIRYIYKIDSEIINIHQVIFGISF